MPVIFKGMAEAHVGGGYLGPAPSPGFAVGDLIDLAGAIVKRFGGLVTLTEALLAVKTAVNQIQEKGFATAATEGALQGSVTGASTFAPDGTVLAEAGAAAIAALAAAHGAPAVEMPPMWKRDP